MTTRRPLALPAALVAALVAVLSGACGERGPIAPGAQRDADGANAPSHPARVYVDHRARERIGPHPRDEFIVAHDGFLAADEPATVPAAAATFLRDGDEVYGVEVEGRARAYAITKLAYHHVVNDVIAGTPVLVTYCVVCSSGVAFDPHLDGQRLTFGFEGVWQGVAIVYDRDTGSLWKHLTGACFDGPHAGRTLTPLTTGTHTTWAAWRHAHPGTDVMAPDPRFASRYFPRRQAESGSSFLSPPFHRTITIRDPRLALSDLVLGLRLGDAARAYPIERLAKTEGVVEETVEGVPLTVWFDASSRTAVAFDARVGGRVRSFDRRPDGFVERATGSRFAWTGRAVDGPLAGTQLQRPTSCLAEWYGWYSHHPHTSIWGP